MIATGMLTLFGLCSCFQVESTITLKKDGSGTITEELVLGEQMVQMMQMGMAQAAQAGGKAEDPMAKMLDKAKAQARAKEMGEGVEFVSIEKIDAGGKLGVKTIFKFSDINKLRYSNSGAMNMGDMPGAKKVEANKDAPLFKYADGKLTIMQKLPKEGDAVAEDDADDKMSDQEKAMMDGMKEMMKDMRISMKMKFEPGIAKTNASHVDGDTITLADIEFGKLLANPEKLKAMQSGNFEKMKKALKDTEGIKFETQETVEVELK